MDFHHYSESENGNINHADEDSVDSNATTVIFHDGEPQMEMGNEANKQADAESEVTTQEIKDLLTSPSFDKEAHQEMFDSDPIFLEDFEGIVATEASEEKREKAAGHSEAEKSGHHHSKHNDSESVIKNGKEYGKRLNKECIGQQKMNEGAVNEQPFGEQHHIKQEVFDSVEAVLEEFDSNEAVNGSIGPESMGDHEIKKELPDSVEVIMEVCTGKVTGTGAKDMVAEKTNNTSMEINVSMDGQEQNDSKAANEDRKGDEAKDVNDEEPQSEKRSRHHDGTFRRNDLPNENVNQIGLRVDDEPSCKICGKDLAISMERGGPEISVAQIRKHLRSHLLRDILQEISANSADGSTCCYLCKHVAKTKGNLIKHLFIKHKRLDDLYLGKTPPKGVKRMQQTSIEAYMNKAKPIRNQMLRRKLSKKRKESSQESSQESVALVQMETKAQVHKDASPLVI